jgi:hypothetical protein
LKPRRHDAGKGQDEVKAVMNDNSPDSDARPDEGKSGARDLPQAAQRALAEAEARRAETKPTAPRELNGRGGLDPVRYGDWEVKGLASDF